MNRIPNPYDLRSPNLDPEEYEIGVCAVCGEPVRSYDWRAELPDGRMAHYECLDVKWLLKEIGGREVDE